MVVSTQSTVKDLNPSLPEIKMARAQSSQLKRATYFCTILVLLLESAKMWEWAYIKSLVARRSTSVAAKGFYTSLHGTCSIYTKKSIVGVATNFDALHINVLPFINVFKS